MGNSERSNLTCNNPKAAKISDFHHVVPRQLLLVLNSEVLGLRMGTHEKSGLPGKADQHF